MSTALIRQAMFSSGEVDAIHYHRTDFKDYLTAAQCLLNVEVGTTGLAKKRKGTKFLLQTNHHDPNSKLFAHEVNLAALTHLLSHERNEVQDIVSVDNTLYLLKNYKNSQQTVLERMDENVKIDGYEAKQLPENGLIEGLNRFEGISIQIIFDDQDYGLYQVKEGKIQVNNPEKKSGHCFVGLLYPVAIRPMYFYAGASNADLMKQTTKIYVEYFQSLNFYINEQLVNYQVFTDIQQGKNLSPQSGTAIITPVLSWNRNKTFVIKQNAPFDLTITAIAYQVAATMI